MHLIRACRADMVSLSSNDKWVVSERSIAAPLLASGFLWLVSSIWITCAHCLGDALQRQSMSTPYCRSLCVLRLGACATTVVYADPITARSSLSNAWSYVVGFGPADITIWGDRYEDIQTIVDLVQTITSQIGLEVNGLKSELPWSS